MPLSTAAPVQQVSAAADNRHIPRSRRRAALSRMTVELDQLLDSMLNTLRDLWLYRRRGAAAELRFDVEPDPPDVVFRSLDAGPTDHSGWCPVTRQRLDGSRPIYRCLSCGMCYSHEGWEFLRRADGGACCGCGERKSVTLAPRSSE